MKMKYVWYIFQHKQINSQFQPVERVGQSICKTLPAVATRNQYVYHNWRLLPDLQMRSWKRLSRNKYATLHRQETIET